MQFSKLALIWRKNWRKNHYFSNHHLLARYFLKSIHVILWMYQSISQKYCKNKLLELVLTCKILREINLTQKQLYTYLFTALLKLVWRKICNVIERLFGPTQFKTRCGKATIAIWLIKLAQEWVKTAVLCWILTEKLLKMAIFALIEINRLSTPLID